MNKVLSTVARVDTLARVTVTILLRLAVLPPSLAAEPIEQGQQRESTPAAPEAEDLDLATFFQGEWEMQGRFRQSADGGWIPTKSRLIAEAKLGIQVILRNIEAPQISFRALDLITYDPRTGVAQYVYLNNNSPTAYVFEGACKDGCRRLELEQICGTVTGKNGCLGRTTMTVESPDRFVARDYIPGASGEHFMSREVIYTRADVSEP